MTAWWFHLEERKDPSRTAAVLAAENCGREVAAGRKEIGRQRAGKPASSVCLERAPQGIAYPVKLRVVIPRNKVRLLAP